MPVIRQQFGVPSRTITAATLAGMFATFLTELILQAGVELRPTLAQAFSVFLSGLAGYLVNEPNWVRVPLSERDPPSDEHEQGGP
jgi:hypothetical protein